MKRPNLRAAGALLAVAIITSLGIAGSSAGAPRALYKGSAQRLMPTAAETGYTEIASQAGTGSRASATYQTPGTTPQSMKVAIRVFKTEVAAKASFDAACPGCALRNSRIWKYKLRLDLGADRNNTVSLVARCRNLRVDTAMATRATNPHTIAGPSRRVIDGIFVKAMRLGMASCEGKGTPPPTSGTHYWTESFAEDMVIRKVRIPHCNVYPDDPNCRLGGSFSVISAECRGLDEKPGTFTYSRFTCEIVLFNRTARGRIAVWPTGPTTFRWEII
jgi:hypothetical protein